MSEPADPTGLTMELGSSRFNQREAAEQALIKFGRAAIPALRGATSSPDPEVRFRAALILRKVEGALLVEPTQVSLNFDNAPLDEVVTALNRQAGIKLSLTPEIPALWSTRRVSMQTGKPLPFWKAIDQLCEVGQLHYVFGGQSDFEQGDSTLALYDGFATSQGLYDDRGPFRVQLTSLQYQSEVHLSADHGRAGKPKLGEATSPDGIKTENVASKQFFIQMRVGAEPRLSIAAGGAVKVIEAVDDQGKSLLLSPRGEFVQHDSGFFGVNPSPLIHLRVDLAYPDQPTARLKKFKGVIPVVVSTRKPDPLEIPLLDASRKTYTQGAITINLGDVRTGQPDQISTIELTIKSSEKAQDDTQGGDPDDGALRTIASPQQLEILDANGRMIPWFPSSSFFNGEEARLTLTLLDRGAAPVVPTTLRYHEVIRDRTEIPFEFRNLPLP